MKLCSGGDFLFCASVILAAGVDRRRAGTWCGDWTVVFQLIEELQSVKVKGCQGWSGAVISSVPAKFQHSETEEKVASPRSASPLWLNVLSKGFFRVIRVFMLMEINTKTIISPLFAELSSSCQVTYHSSNTNWAWGESVLWPWTNQLWGYLTDTMHEAKHPLRIEKDDFAGPLQDGEEISSPVNSSDNHSNPEAFFLQDTVRNYPMLCIHQTSNTEKRAHWVNVNC